MNGAYDAVIIGGGPAGLTAAIYASRLGLKTLVSDSGARGSLGSASKIENFPGIPRGIPGGKLISILRKQAENFGAEIITARTTAAVLSSAPKEISLGSLAYTAGAVIIAPGAMGRKAGIKGEAEFTGKGVSYCAACDAPFFRGKRVAMVGGIKQIQGELAAVGRFAEKIYAVIPSPPRPGEDEDKAFSGEAEVFGGYSAVEIYGDKFVEGLKIKNKSGETRDLPASGVFVYLRGNEPEIDFIGEKIKLGEDGCLSVDPATMATSIEGVYAAGDVVCKEFRQAVVAAAEGCKAALSAESFISKRKKPRHSWH